MSLDYETLTLSSLEKLDEKIGIKFRQLVAEVANDCFDRPNTKGKRVVVLECEVEPEMDEEGNLDTVNLKVQFKKKVPQYQSKQYRLLPTRQGFKFNAGSPTSPRQHSLDLAEEDAELD